MANELKINITGDSSSYKKAMQEANDITAKVSGAVQSFIGNLAANAVANLVSNVQAFAVESLAAYKEAEQNQAQLNAVLASTQNAAGLTATELNEMAEALMKVTTFDDDAITGAQSLLLTFTKIGKDVFPEATKTVLDMSAALGQDLKSSSIQLGKALNDPIQGVTALRRVGVSFTESQLEQIKVMQQSGDIMGAQKLILNELATEFGGSAEAITNTRSGPIEQLKNQIGDIEEMIGGKLAAILDFLIVNEDKVVQFFEGLAKGLIVAAAAWGTYQIAVNGAAIATTIATGGLNLLLAALAAFVAFMAGNQKVFDGFLEIMKAIGMVLFDFPKQVATGFSEVSRLMTSGLDKIKTGFKESFDFKIPENNTKSLTTTINKAAKATRDWAAEEKEFHKKMMSDSEERAKQFADELDKKEKLHDENLKKYNEKQKTQLELDEFHDEQTLKAAEESVKKEEEIRAESYQRISGLWSRIHSDMWDDSRSFTEKVNDLVKDMVMNFTLEIGNMVIAHALGEESMTATSSANAATRVAKRLWEATVTIASKVKEGVVWLVTEGYKTATVVAGSIARAAQASWEFIVVAGKKLAEIAVGLWASMLDFFSFLGPFAIPAAAAGVAIGIAAVKSSVAAIGFSKGGEFEEGQRGYIEGTVPGGEVIAPKKDFMKVITEIIPSITLANSAPAIDYNQLAAALSTHPMNVFLNGTKVNYELAQVAFNDGLSL